MAAENIGGVLANVEWEPLQPNLKFTWLVPDNFEMFDNFIPLGTKSNKLGDVDDAIFNLYGLGISTHRDTVVYDFDPELLSQRVKDFIDEFNLEIDRYRRATANVKSNNFNHNNNIKWSEGLKSNLSRGQYAEFDSGKIRIAMYRPFTKTYLFFDEILNERRYQFPQFLPLPFTEKENIFIWLKTGSEWPMFALASNQIVDLLPSGGSQCFPFYVYDPDGSNRRENITDWALKQFRAHYGDDTISKWDIFYYVYGLLHHPAYREKFADNLKRELPRIPFAPALDAALTLNPSPKGEGLNNQQILPSPAGEEPGVRANQTEGTTKELVSKVMIQIGRELRQRQTDAEGVLWEYLRDRRLGDVKVRRQHPIPNTTYVVDFFCNESRLVIELDGPIHEHQQQADMMRQQELESLGYHVIRFTNEQVFNSPETVLTTILDSHRRFLPALKSPSPAGEGLGVRASSSGFWAFANAGRQLADLHLNYEQAPIYPLKRQTAKELPLSYRVEKMRLNKDKTALQVNESLTLSGIPAEAFEYRLGNRSALDWVIDQYQVTTDKRSGITSDPNREDDEQYIVNLVGRVVTVSVETVKIVKSLPEQFSES